MASVTTKKKQAARPLNQAPDAEACELRKKQWMLGWSVQWVNGVCIYHNDSDNGNNNNYYYIIIIIIDSVSSRHESFYKVSLLIPATILCPYSHFVDLEAEDQEGAVTCPLLHSEIADIWIQAYQMPMFLLFTIELYWFSLKYGKWFKVVVVANSTLFIKKKKKVGIDTIFSSFSLNLGPNLKENRGSKALHIPVK